MNDPCFLELLESALAGTLSPHDEQSLGAHLETCAECNAQLEHLAGGPAWRRHAAALLVGDELDESLPARDEWWDVDFSVEHLEPSSDPSALGRVGPYDILEIVGRGGMGIVLKGFDPELKRCVAIKVLAPHLAQSSLAKKRFAREAQAAAAIVHPNVLAIHQVQPNGRLPFLVMPFVAGESLAQRLAARGTLELTEILRIGMQAAAGLAAAHEQGLVHRDVKPANILLEKGVERAVITDFGLARAADDVSITRLGIIAGTPQYMSPEQARGEALDGRSDLFSLGCVLYEMATGVSPFRADSAMATMRRLVDEAPQALASLNPELPPWYCAIVDRLMEKAPARRFGSAKEVSELLESCLAHLQQPTGVPLPAALASVGRVCDPSEPSGRVTDPSYKKDARTRAKWSWRTKGALIMIATLGIALASFLAFVDPPDIAGEWSGPDWGKIVLKQLRSTDYTGSYTDTFGKQAGEMTLSWSRLENRFVGTWREADDRFGEISLRLVGSEIRGAYTTDPKSKINPGTPRLAEFAWTRGSAGFQPFVEREVDGAIDFETGKLAKIPELKVDNATGEVAAVAKWMEQNGMDAYFDAHSLLTFGMKVAPGKIEDWEKATPPQLAVRIMEIDPAESVLSRLRPGANGPVLYVIQTREGSVGIVQVLGFKDDNKTALKIRYKKTQLAFDAVAKELKAKDKSLNQAFRDGDRKIAFSMNDKPWREVIDWVVDQTGLVFIALQAAPTGSFKFISPSGATYSFPEVVDIINEGLQQHQYQLIRRDASFSVISVDQPLDGNLVARVTIDQLERRGKTEIVQVLVPLKVMNADEFAPEVKKQLGPFGSVVSLTAANQLLVQDSAGNLRRLMKTIDLIEKDDETETYSYKCIYVKASQAELFLKDILGDPRVKGNQGVGPGGAQKQPRVVGVPRIRSDDRTNTVFLNAQPNRIAQARSYLKNFDQPQFAGQQPILIGAPEIKNYDIPAGNAEVLVKVLSDLPAFRPTLFFRMSAVSPTRIMVYGGPQDQMMVAKELNGQIPAAELAPRKQTANEPDKKPAIDPVPRKQFRFQTANPVQDIAYSPDETLIALAGDDTNIKVLDAKTGAALRTIQTANAQEDAIFRVMKQLNDGVRVYKLVFAPDSGLLATGNSIGQVKLFNVRTGALLKTLDAGIRDRKPEDVKDPRGEFFNDGKGEFPQGFGGFQGGGFQGFKGGKGGKKGGFEMNIDPSTALFDRLANNRPYFTIPESGDLRNPLAEFAKEQGITDEKITRDLFLKFNETVSTKARSFPRAHTWIANIVFSPDGATLATCGAAPVAVFGAAGKQSSFELWDVKTGARKTQDTEVYSSLAAASFSPDGKVVATISIASRGLDLHDSRSGKKISTMAGVSGNAIAFLPDGKRLAIESRAQHQISIVYPASQVVETTWQPGGNGTFLAFSRDGTAAVFRSNNNKVSYVDVTKQSLIRRFTLPRAPGERWDLLITSPRGGEIAVGGVDPDGQNFVEAWNVGFSFADRPKAPSTDE